MHRSRSVKLKGILPLLLLQLTLIVLLIAGGSSRADASGQIIVRLIAWFVLGVSVCFCAAPDWKSVRIPLAFLMAATAVVAAQLVPLPPSVWLSLPNRSLLAHAAQVLGEPQPWRPWSMSPDATINAVQSLVVPAAVAILVAMLKMQEHWKVLATLIALVGVSAIIALMQASGGHFSNPFVKDIPGAVSATFANRNHLALFLSLGCAMIPAWGLREGNRQKALRITVAVGLLVLVGLMVVATGSRMGLLLVALALIFGLASAAGPIRSQARRLPRKWRIWLMLGSAMGLALVGAATVLLGRAASVNRALASYSIENRRAESLPTIWRMIREYFPWGSGAGAFDPVYRISESLNDLHFEYLNHAHNDWLEVVLDTGAFGLLLLVAMVAVFGWFSFRAWRNWRDRDFLLARVGSSMLLLIFVASTVDYPVRTPMVMAVGMIAAIWLTAPKPGPKVAGKR